MHMGMYTTCLPGAWGGLKKTPYPNVLELLLLRAVMEVLGTKSVSFTRAKGIFKLLALSPAIGSVFQCHLLM